MATIVNTPASTTDNGSGAGFMLGVIALLVFLAVLIFYGIPALQRAGSSTAPSVNVPENIDVNVNPNGGNTGGQQ